MQLSFADACDRVASSLILNVLPEIQVLQAGESLRISLGNPLC